MGVLGRNGGAGPAISGHTVLSVAGSDARHDEPATITTREHLDVLLCFSLSNKTFLRLIEPYSHLALVSDKYSGRA